MCGINGFTWQDRDLIGRMNAHTAHRGPDGSSVWSDAQVTLGHNRLAIIDLDARSAQPMHSADDRYVIAFNGEIYNFEALKRELAPYPFKTTGDTEVILAGYAAWGNGIWERLNGMFAIALYDRAEATLTLVRDAVGIKPLYYHFDGTKFAFSSELHALALALPSRNVSATALNHYFDLGYVPGPHTLFEDAHKLEPGTYATIARGTLALSRFTPAVAAGAGGLEDTISSAVKRQLVSDRPVGVFLSGGLDSSIILHHVMEHKGEADTFTLGFTLPESAKTEEAKFNEDLLLARTTATHYRSRHHEHMIGDADISGALPEIFRAMDEPVANPTIIATYFLSKFAREHVVVGLDGSGGDELFGGYTWYRANRLRTLMRQAPTFVRHALSHVGGPFSKFDIDTPAAWYLAYMGSNGCAARMLTEGYLMSSATGTYLTEKFFRGRAVENYVDAMMNVDRLLWLVDESLMRSDKMSMAHGLEMRVPLLDLELIAKATTIPDTQKVTLRETKKILRDTYRHILPAHLVDAPKRGWFSPGAKWLRNPEVLRYARELLSPSFHQGTADAFRFAEIERMLEDHIAGRSYNNKALWTMIMFQAWAHEHNARLP